MAPIDLPHVLGSFLQRTSNQFNKTPTKRSESPSNDTSITLPRTTFIAIIAICGVLVLLSLLVLLTACYRSRQRQKQLREAKAWGRNSRYAHRVSQLCKAVDDDYRTRYTGCLASVPENPELGSDSPKELMLPEPKVWEMPGSMPEKGCNASAASKTQFLGAPTQCGGGGGGGGSGHGSAGAWHGKVTPSLSSSAKARRLKRLTLFFDYSVGLWLPKK